ncbi:MAG: urease accessory protein UreF [Rhizobacter sp.]|nr:urease accessory protein UreF [Ferruginibacter sp.]
MSAALFNLLHLSDPTLPIGGYAHSAGLETFVQQGTVHDVVTAEKFVTEMLSTNVKFTDAAFASLAFDAFVNKDYEGLLALDEECNAIKIPEEMRQAGIKMGNRLLKIFSPVNDHPVIAKYHEDVLQKKATGHYPVVFGICAATMDIPKNEMLTGFFYNAAVGFVTNCVKLIPLGQQQGQQILHSIQPLLQELVEAAVYPDKEMIGICCAGFDIAQMQHEQLYTRLYMS